MNYQKKNAYSTYKSTVKPPPKWRFDKLFAMLAAVLLLAPFLFFQLYGYVGNSAVFVSPCFTALALGLGYAAQIVYARLRKFERVRMDGSYENTEQIFIPSRAAGSYTLAGVVMVAVIFAAKAYLRWRVDTGLDLYFDNNALFPYIFAPTCALFIVLGAIAWFYPAKWIISIRLLIPSVAIVVVCFAITWFIYRIDLTFWAVSTLIAAVFALISYLLTRYYASFMKTV